MKTTLTIIASLALVACGSATEPKDYTPNNDAPSTANVSTLLAWDALTPNQQYDVCSEVIGRELTKENISDRFLSFVDGDRDQANNVAEHIFAVCPL